MAKLIGVAVAKMIGVVAITLIIGVIVSSAFPNITSYVRSVRDRVSAAYLYSTDADRTFPSETEIPSCINKNVIPLIKEIEIEHSIDFDKQRGVFIGFSDANEIQRVFVSENMVANAMDFQLADVRKTAIDKDLGKVSCAAHLTVSLNADAIKWDAPRLWLGHKVRASSRAAALEKVLSVGFMFGPIPRPFDPRGQEITYDVQHTEDGMIDVGLRPHKADLF